VLEGLFSSGWVKVGRFGRAPIRVHWTTPIGVFLLTHLSFNPFDWLAVCLLLLVHELGHAFLARRHRLAIVSIDMTAIGGACRIAGDPTLREAATVAWGGVIGQGLLLALALVVRGILHFITGMFDGFFDVLITTNILLAVVNLLPIRGLDGALAWRLFTR
jgi:Zn-dependent protease